MSKSLKYPSQLLGMKFDRLTVEGFHSEEKYVKRWNCKCSCGKTVVVRHYQLLTGRSKSCGCLRVDRTVAHFTKHGGASGAGTREYETWCGIKKRCNNPKEVGYRNYGARGIKVCERWKNSFANFLEDMGPRPDGFSIERKDVNGDYSPENCIWILHKLQFRNMRKNVSIEHEGERLLPKDISKRFNVDLSTVYKRLERGITSIAELSAPSVRQLAALRRSSQ